MAPSRETWREVFTRARLAPSLVVLEDLDSMIHNQNRSFFLNELDGFRVNTGVVVLATTNHPEKLDTAILDRPSRFDRKYHFELPGEPERLAYIERWNSELQAELRVSADGCAVGCQRNRRVLVCLSEGVVCRFDGAMDVDSGETPMKDVLVAQARSLRAQMNTAQQQRKRRRKRKASASGSSRR